MMLRKPRFRVTAHAAVALLGLLPATQSATAQTPSDGQKIFEARCKMCHQVKPGAKAVVAPNLAGVFGRKAASTSYPGYSSALKQSGLEWNQANLDTYLAAPGRKVPGTRMVVNIADAKQRAAVIAYLRIAKD